MSYDPNLAFFVSDGQVAGGSAGDRRHPRATRRGAVSGGWHAALRRYLIATAVGHLAWEFLHMPLYTIWREGTWGEVAFAALHCTGGDVLIALTSLMLALLLLGNETWPRERFRPVAALAIALGVGYTAFSEWLNVVVRAAWDYSELMPILSPFGVEVGLSPLLQWIVVPAVAFALAGRAAASAGAQRRR